MASLPTDSSARKRIPLASGVLDYFPLALIAVAELSMAGNDQHNKGQPLHWAREKSNDHDDCLMRHFLERGAVDTDGIAHRAKVAWRALAALQLECERNQPTGCNAQIQPARQTAKQAYDDQTRRDVGWSVKRGDYNLPPSLAAAVTAPNCDGNSGSRIATEAEIAERRSVLSVEELKGFGIGDVPRERSAEVRQSAHPLHAVALQDADEYARSNGGTGV